MYAFWIHNSAELATSVDVALRDATDRFVADYDQDDMHLWASMGVLNLSERDTEDEDGSIRRDHYIALTEAGALWLMLHTPPDATLYWSQDHSPLFPLPAPPTP